MNLYQDFKWEIVAGLPQANFTLDNSIVENWIKEKTK
jgi:hypothetical protein